MLGAAGRDLERNGRLDGKSTGNRYCRKIAEDGNLRNDLLGDENLGYSRWEFEVAYLRK